MIGGAFCVLTASILALAGLVSSRQVCFTGSEYGAQSGDPRRWFLPVEDPCQCTSIRVGGITHEVLHRQGAPYRLKELILSENPGEIQTFFKCAKTETAECLEPDPLGMEDGRIPDENIHASSSYGEYAAYNGRLNKASTWIPKRNDDSWMEVDLVESTLVSGVITQGSNWHAGRVKEYRVAYQNQSPPSPDSDYVKDANGAIKVFVGNTNDPRESVCNLFHQSILATRVRIEPLDWNAGTLLGLRFELLGCHL